MSRMAEEQIAWTAVKTGEAVVTSDGATIGKVVEVAALASEDIFHGIVFEHAHHRKHYLAPAADIALITTTAIHLSIDAAAADSYKEFEQLHVSRLGLKGVFRWSHFGWKDSNE
jgi:hypothetical protein